MFWHILCLYWGRGHGNVDFENLQDLFLFVGFVICICWICDLYLLDGVIFVSRQLSLPVDIGNPTDYFVRKFHFQLPSFSSWLTDWPTVIKSCPSWLWPTRVWCDVRSEQFCSLAMFFEVKAKDDDLGQLQDSWPMRQKSQSSKSDRGSMWSSCNVFAMLFNSYEKTSTIVRVCNLVVLTIKLLMWKETFVADTKADSSEIVWYLVQLTMMIGMSSNWQHWYSFSEQQGGRLRTWMQVTKFTFQCKIRIVEMCTVEVNPDSSDQLPMWGLTTHYCSNRG